MIKFKIDKQNGSVFILIAKAIKDSEGQYKLWYRENKFWHNWQFVGVAKEPNAIEQVIYYHFGFTSNIQRIS